MFQYQQQYDQLPPAAALFHPPQLMPPAMFYRRHCRRTGKVKFFNMAKGYGFIIPNQPQYPQEQNELKPYKKASSPTNESKANRVEEVFVHHTSILSLNKGYLATLNKVCSTPFICLHVECLCVLCFKIREKRYIS
ncbi:unnamed protein product [Mucor circinelloides]